MYVPGNDEGKIKKIPSLNVDCVILDCEDGVALNRKVSNIMHNYTNFLEILIRVTVTFISYLYVAFCFIYKNRHLKIMIVVVFSTLLLLVACQEWYQTLKIQMH